MKKYKIAVLDDSQSVALESADWSLLRGRGDCAVAPLTTPARIGFGNLYASR